MRNVSSVRSMVDVMCMGVLVVTLCFSMYRPGIGGMVKRIHLGEIRQGMSPFGQTPK